MDSESEWVYDRMRLYKLMVAHPGLSSARLAEAVGRSARWVRKWVARFKATEQPDMRLFASQSRAPKRRPRQVGEAVKDAICQLRQALSEQYHRPAGALLIRVYLLKDEVVKALGGFVPRSSRTITRILRERGYIRTPPKPTHMPLALCAPMDEWEMDFCEVRLADGRLSCGNVVSVERDVQRADRHLDLLYFADLFREPLRQGNALPPDADYRQFLRALVLFDDLMGDAGQSAPYLIRIHDLRAIIRHKTLH